MIDARYSISVSLPADDLCGIIKNLKDNNARKKKRDTYLPIRNIRSPNHSHHTHTHTHMDTSRQSNNII